MSGHEPTLEAQFAQGVTALGFAVGGEGALVAQWLGAFDQDDDLLIYLKDADARWVACNHAAFAFLGVESSSEVVGLRDVDFYPSSIAERIAADDRDILRSGAALRRKPETVVAQGRSLIAVETTKIALRDARQTICGLAGVTRVVDRAPQAWAGPGNLARVVAHVATHAGEALDLPQLARIACLSQSQLRRQFKQHLAVSPHRFVTEVRLQNAAQALRRGRAPVATVAVENGFCNQSHFTTAFSRAFGVSPAEYRRRGRREGSGAS